MHDVGPSEGMSDGEPDFLGPTCDYDDLAGCRESGQYGRDAGIGFSVVKLGEGVKDVHLRHCCV